jgi:hypothetical protein
MPNVIRENMQPARTGFKLGMGQQLAEASAILANAQGRIFVEMRDAKTNELQLEREIKNVVTLDASLEVARLMKDPQEPAHGINMLGVGTGALGAILNPDAPTNEQRRLNNEIARKPFSETTFRDSNGAAVSIPTNVVDFTTIYGESEAVGPLNEMGLLSTISDNTATINNNPNFAGQGGQPYDPTIDVANYDILVNYLTFSVITKPATSILTITWRLTF